MRLNLVMISLCLTIISCTSLKDKKDDPVFSDLTQTFLDEYWKTHPGHASLMGLAEYDGILEIPNDETREKRKSFYQKYLNKFQQVEEDDLSLTQRTDRKLIMNKLEGSLWSYNEFKAYEWNPAAYNIGEKVSAVLEKKKRPLKDRLEDISKKLLNAQAYYKAAKNNIKNPTREHTNLAITQTKGLIRYLKGDVRKAIGESSLTSREKSTVRQRVDSAVTAANRYISFLKGVLSNPKKVGGFRSFRIGKDLYAKKFSYDLQIESTPEELYKKALDAKQEMRSKLFETAIELYPKYYGEKLPPHDRQKVITQIIGKVSKEHAKPGEFIASVEKQIPELTKFVNDKKLLSLDPSRPLKVRETPLYERGEAMGATVDAPGPFDKTGDTFYNVTPIKNKTKKQQESYLREYNNYTMQILNIHEAIPGHYVQLVYRNNSPSIVKVIFRNDPLVEGWAVYAERMMLEEGYGENSPELWLMYYKWFLRVVTNTIIDYEIHNKELSKKDAIKMMTQDAFQEVEEAKGKWQRATVTQVQLASYFGGFSEIYELRERIKKDEGDDFNLKEFHETFLSFGSAPIKEIKALML